MSNTIPNIYFIDSTLRDGNHAVRHTITEEQIAAYAKAADNAHIPVVIVGHGNGLGASSLQVGESVTPDLQMLKVARKHLKSSKLGVYMIPGFATINKDVKPALDAGVDVVCVGCHCTEVDTTERYINYVREHKKEVYGNLMMTHMVPKEVLIQECLKSQSYGAHGVTLMDSAGAFIEDDVTEKISALVHALEIKVGFHAHNNLGLAVSNSVAAVKAGAEIIDGCVRGFGAGAGNAQLEVLVAVFKKMGIPTGIDLYKILEASDIAEKNLIKDMPRITSVSVVSGLAGVFSGFAQHVKRVSQEYNVDPWDVFFELGKRKAVAGQEDLIIEVAIQLADQNKKTRNI